MTTILRRFWIFIFLFCASPRISQAGSISKMAGGENSTPFPISLNLSNPETVSGPAQVILIRHAEKPETGPDLNERGEARAAALVNFFRTNPAVNQHGLPAVIYAAAPVSEGKSRRSIETVTPLAQNLGLKINENYTTQTADQMVNDVMHNPDCSGKMALVCWEHKGIPDLLKDFGWDAGPNSWPGGDVFDRVWILNFQNGKPVSFQDLPQHLLPGDSSQ